MNHAMRIKKVLVCTGSVLLQFAHGGLVVTGLLVAVLIGSRLSHNGLQTTQSQLKNWVSMVWVLGNGPAAASVPSLPSSGLNPELRRVADYLARRYHVAIPAVEPLVATAQSIGSRLGLDPTLILAVMAVESSFNPFAESHLGAQGLMQVIPKFHQDILAQQDEQDNPLLDPLTNINVGAQVLKESIQRAGNVKDGLQQYGGAIGDADAEYAGKVLALKQQLDQAKRDARQIGADTPRPPKQVS